MNAFSYTRALDISGAVNEVSTNGGAQFIAGGTNLIDLMKENVSRPNRLIDGFAAADFRRWWPYCGAVERRPRGSPLKV